MKGWPQKGQDLSFGALCGGFADDGVEVELGAWEDEGLADWGLGEGEAPEVGVLAWSAIMYACMSSCL